MSRHFSSPLLPSLSIRRCLCLLAGVVFYTSCQKQETVGETKQSPPPVEEKTAAPSAAAIAPEKNTFEATILVANREEFKPTIMVDKLLVNPWGIALRPPGKGGHIWTSNAGNASTTLYIGDVSGEPLHQDGLKVVPMEGPLLSYEDGLPNVTGQVYNAASDIPGQPIEFSVKGATSDYTSGKAVPLGEIAGAAKFVFVTTDGTINAWRAKTSEAMDSAVIVKDFSDKGKDQDTSLKYLPAYTGCAMTTTASIKDSDGKSVADNRLYVTDFQNKRIQTFDNQWKEITKQCPFPRPAGMPESYSPYNIQWLGDRLCVAYAEIDYSADEPAVDVPGEGIGHIAFYDRDGKLLSELEDHGKLNSPWGVCVAPEGFGSFGGNLLVANFGDGSIAAFDMKTGKFHDFLRDKNHEPLNLDGIWGMVFGNGVSLGQADALYYTAGPNNEQDGVLGRLKFVE